MASARRIDNQQNSAWTAVLHERARIARELHDSVSQTLYAISLGASRVRGLLQQNADSETQRIVEDLLQLANAGQSELRTLLTDIGSDRFTGEGLKSAVAELAADIRSQSGIDIHVSAVDAPDLPPRAGEALYLIIREALHNVVRHSAARRVEIVLERNQGHLVARVTDDGCGFDTAAHRPGHFGLQSMRERATAVGGKLALTSALGRGTQLRVCIPVLLETDG